MYTLTRWYLRHGEGVLAYQTGGQTTELVGFDRQGAVVWKDRLPVLHCKGTFGDTLCRWLGL